MRVGYLGMGRVRIRELGSLTTAARAIDNIEPSIDNHPTLIEQARIERRREPVVTYKRRRWPVPA